MSKEEKDIKAEEAKEENSVSEEENVSSEENTQEETKDSEKEDTEALKKELEELKDKYARVFADFENTKKRLEREKYQAIEYANEKFAKDMIPVIDSLEGALNSVNADAPCEELLQKMKEGLELTFKQFITNLNKHGIERVEHDEPFDPNVHNAVQSVDHDEKESGEIVQTFQTGYKYKGRTLREAMVVVAN